MRHCATDGLMRGISAMTNRSGRVGYPVRPPNVLSVSACERWRVRAAPRFAVCRGASNTAEPATKLFALSLGCTLDSRAGNTAVNLIETRSPAALIAARVRSIFGIELSDEGLPAEAVRQSHEDHVELVEDVHEGRDIGCWL